VVMAQAGAERAVLILTSETGPQIAAEAMTSGDAVTVHLRDEPVTAAMLPETVLRYVLRSRESTILEDAAAQSPFAADPYIRQHQVRSVLFLPLLNQAKLIGVLYLENNLAPRVFSPGRISVLKLLASQAAISLENTRLYRDLAEREAKIRRLVDANIIGIFVSDIEGRIIEANDAFLEMLGYDREDLASGRVNRTNLTPPDWRERDARTVAEVKATGTVQPFEKEYFRKDGSRISVLLGVTAFDVKRNQGIGFVLDLTERKRAAEALHEMQMALTHATRVATMGQLTASIAHEVSQPITATIANARAGSRWLEADLPDVDEARQAFNAIVRDGERAGQIIGRIRSLIKKAPPRMDRMDINEAILDVVALTQSELLRHRVLLRTDLAIGLPLIEGDRVQLQQVMLNLVFNAIEAMEGNDEAIRELGIGSKMDGPNRVVVAVRDTGSGIDAKNAHLLFEAFYTTKTGGMGIGLSLSRSIIEAHDGRLWASANEPRGAIFQFTVPALPVDPS